MTLETLSSPPSLAKIFARSAISRGGGGDELPDLTLRLEENVVDRARLADYQRLCGWPVGDVLPHTFPQVVGFPLQAELMSRKGFPLPLAGLVHVENVITVHRPVHAGERLDVTVHAEDLRPHAKGRVVDLVTEVDVSGGLVWEGRSTYLARGGGDDAAPRGEQPPTMPRGASCASWSLAGDLGRRYAGVSGDVNPIHLHPLTARALGFPRAIAHGMWTYARSLAALGPSVDVPGASHVWFRRPVLLPATVDLVIDKGAADGTVVAGLRAARRPETEHLVLTWRP